jgi:hypothetical protein
MEYCCAHANTIETDKYTKVTGYIYTGTENSFALFMPTSLTTLLRLHENTVKYNR